MDTVVVDRRATASEPVSDSEPASEDSEPGVERSCGTGPGRDSEPSESTCQ
jgi:hypothetical protein